MTSIDELKIWLHLDLSRTDKLLLILSSFDGPCQVWDIKKKGIEAGFRIHSNWNISSLLSTSKGLAIRIETGWEITEIGLKHLEDLRFCNDRSQALQVAFNLRDELPNITDPDTRVFAEEAIKCHEAGLYRATIVMSWMAAVGVLHNHVHSYHLKEFNAESRRVNQRWKNAKTPDDLGKMKEEDFLDRLVGLSLIGTNVKTELKACLDRRNSCGHPTSLSIGVSTSAYHLEILLLNVFKRFA